MSQPGEQEVKPRYMRRSITRTPTGMVSAEETVVHDLAHRLHDPTRDRWLVPLSERFGGLVNNVVAMFGHLPEKERNQRYLAAKASVMLYSLSDRLPSVRRIADEWFLSEYELPNEISMGVEGRAIVVEKTSITKQVTTPEKKGWLRR
jgi:hypothetical protein